MDFDDFFMREALKLAKKAIEEDEEEYIEEDDEVRPTIHPEAPPGQPLPTSRGGSNRGGPEWAEYGWLWCDGFAAGGDFRKGAANCAAHGARLPFDVFW